MEPTAHPEDHATTPQKGLTLSSLQGVSFKKGDNDVPKVSMGSNPITHDITALGPHHATAKITLEGVEHGHIAYMLCHGKLREHLDPQGHLWIFVEGHVKIALPIHKAQDPLGGKPWRHGVPNVWSLRIHPQGGVFPADCPHVRHSVTAEEILSSSCAVLEEFPAYGLVLLRLAKA